MELKGFERAYLMREAHRLSAIVYVGKQGGTPAVLKALDEALTAHELIKVRFVDCKDERETISAELAENSGSTLVAVRGNVAVFYRPAPDAEKRRFVLPGQGLLAAFSAAGKAKKSNQERNEARNAVKRGGGSAWSNRGKGGKNESGAKGSRGGRAGAGRGGATGSRTAGPHRSGTKARRRPG